MVTHFLMSRKILSIPLHTLNYYGFLLTWIVRAYLGARNVQLIIFPWQVTSLPKCAFDTYCLIADGRY